jgi:exodeoxyribonuclease-1
MLAPENGFSSHNAHDALGDVEATIFLSKKIIDGNRRLWEQLLETRNKHYVRKLFESIKPIEIVLRFGGAEPKSYFGCFCGVSSNNQNSYGFFDLEIGQGLELLSGSEEDLAKAVDGSPKHIRAISINNAPPVLTVAAPNSDWLEVCETLKKDDSFQQRVGHAMASRFEEMEDEERLVEERIYGGFYSKNDQGLLHQFQIEDWPARAELISQFEDLRLKQLGRRLISFYAPSALAHSSQERLNTFLRKKWFADETKVPWTTFAEVKKQLDEIMAKPELAQKTKDNLMTYYNDKKHQFD